MRAPEQRPAQQLLAAQAGNGADRFVDAQEAAEGIDLHDPDRGVLIGGGEPLLLLAQLALAAIERFVDALELGNVLEAIDDADHLAAFVGERIDIDEHHHARSVRASTTTSSSRTGARSPAPPRALIAGAAGRRRRRIHWRR